MQSISVKPVHTLGSSERLKSRKAIEALFSDGLRLHTGSLRFLYRMVTEPGLRIGVGVSSRHFKRAVDRNRIKRQLRECYRLQKQLLQVVPDRGQGMEFFIIYSDKKMPVYADLFLQLQQGLQQLAEKIKSR